MENDAKVLERALPDLVSIAFKRGGLFPCDILGILGSDWLMRTEASSLSSLAAELLIASRLRFTPTASSNLSRQGAVLLQSPNQKKIRQRKHIAMEEAAAATKMKKELAEKAKADKAALCEVTAVKIVHIVDGEKSEDVLSTMFKNLQANHLRALLDARWDFNANPIEKYANAKKEVLVAKAVQYFLYSNPEGGRSCTVNERDDDYATLENMMKKKQAGSTSTTSMDASNVKPAAMKQKQQKRAVRRYKKLGNDESDYWHPHKKRDRSKRGDGTPSKKKRL